MAAGGVQSAPATPGCSGGRAAPPKSPLTQGGDGALPTLKARSLLLPSSAVGSGSDVFPVAYAWRRSGLRLPTKIEPPAIDAAAAAVPWLHSAPSWLNRQRLNCLVSSSALLILYRSNPAADPAHQAPFVEGAIWCPAAAEEE